MYSVVFVKDNDLPPETLWAVYGCQDGSVYVLLKRTAVTAQVLAEAWAATRRLDEQPPSPRLRVVSGH